MIIQYQDLTQSKTVGPVDVCIIGSGAGGGAMAYYLARAGFSVVVLEKGGYYPPAELGRKELYMLTRIEAPTIFTPATGEYSRVSLIAGQCYGGGTVASESVTWDLPKVVMEDWVKLGLKSFDPEKNPKLEAYQAELNKLLSVKPVAMEHHNRCNQILAIGAQREGIRWKSSDRPVDFCFRCGNCTQGCHYGVKQDAANTFLTWSHKFKTEVYCGAEADRVKINFPTEADYPYSEKLKAASGSAKDDLLRELASRKNGALAKFTVTARVVDAKAPAPRKGGLDYRSLTVHSHNVVMAAGPVATSRILLKSKINPNGVVGTKFSTQPGSMNMARFPQNIEIRGWDGINDSTEIYHYADIFRNEPYYDKDKHGFLCESALSLPWGMANILPGAGKELLAVMKDLNHWSGIEAIIKSDAYGRITEDDIKIDISERDNEAMTFATWVIGRVFFRAGAREIRTALPGLTLKSPNQLDEIFKYRFQNGKRKGFMVKQANLYSGHHFGGAIMGADRTSSFADDTGECHDLKGLWVGDGSSFPTTVGVNCAMSIMVVARKIADDFIAKVKPA